jgi:hypothetical protein
MQTISTLIRWEMWFLLGSLALIIAYQTLTGKIRTRRMLFEKNGSQNLPLLWPRENDPERNPACLCDRHGRQEPPICGALSMRIIRG